MIHPNAGQPAPSNAVVPITDLLCRARASLANRDFEGALAAWEQVLQQEPGNGEANFHVAHAFLRTNDVAKALAYAQRMGMAPGWDGGSPTFEEYRSFTDAFHTRRAASPAGSPAILLCALPKSASVFLWVTLAALLKIPMCRIAIGDFLDAKVVPAWAETFARGSAVTHDHLAATAENLEGLAAAGLSRIYVHVRDPRQAVLSKVHMMRSDMRRRIRKGNASESDHRLGNADPGVLIDGILEHQLKANVEWIGGWLRAQEHDRAAFDIRVGSFEEMHVDNVAYLEGILSFFGAQGRPDVPIAEVIRIVNETPGGRNFRKGETDEWRRAFTPEQQELAWRLIDPTIRERFGLKP